MLTDSTTPAADPTLPAAPAFEIGATYTLEPWQGEWLQEKLAGIAKRARRSGVDASPSLVPAGEPYPEWRKARSEFWNMRRTACGACLVVDRDAGERCEPGTCPVHWVEFLLQDFVVHGTMPVIPGGWRLLAAIDRVPGVGAIVREAPGHVCPPEFRGDDAANRCDHCHARRPRRVCYVLADSKYLDPAIDGGQVIQVGSTCIAEFIRDPRVEAAIDAILSAQAVWAGVPREDEDGNPLQSRGQGPRPLATYLAHVAAYTRDNRGVYVTRAAAGDGCTAEQAWLAQEATTADERRHHPDLRTQVDAIVAARAIEWAAALPVDGSAFEQNMRTMARAGAFDIRHKGTAAYIVPAYQKAQGQFAARSEKPTTAPRLAADEGAKKVLREVEVVRKASFDSMYGTTYITAMRVVAGDDAGAVVVWKSKDVPMIRSADSMRSVAESFNEPEHAGWAAGESARGAGTRTPASIGDRLTIEFTVKSHGEYKGALETMISRVAMVCDGWGYAAAAGTPEAALAARMVAEGRNALPVKPARKPRAAKGATEAAAAV